MRSFTELIKATLGTKNSIDEEIAIFEAVVLKVSKPETMAVVKETKMITKNGLKNLLSSIVLKLKPINEAINVTMKI